MIITQEKPWGEKAGGEPQETEKNRHDADRKSKFQDTTKVPHTHTKGQKKRFAVNEIKKTNADM